MTAGHEIGTAVKNTDPNLDMAVSLERALLACIMERPQLIAEVECDLSADFLLTDHRALWRAMVELHEEGVEPADQVLLAERAGVDVVGSLLASGAVVANFPNYA